VRTASPGALIRADVIAAPEKAVHAPCTPEKSATQSMVVDASPVTLTATAPTVVSAMIAAPANDIALSDALELVESTIVVDAAFAPLRARM
jgi:hypothetical protein